MKKFTILFSVCLFFMSVKIFALETLVREIRHKNYDDNGIKKINERYIEKIKNKFTLLKQVNSANNFVLNDDLIRYIGEFLLALRFYFEIPTGGEVRDCLISGCYEIAGRYKNYKIKTINPPRSFSGPEFRAIIFTENDQDEYNLSFAYMSYDRAEIFFHVTFSEEDYIPTGVIIKVPGNSGNIQYFVEGNDKKSYVYPDSDRYHRIEISFCDIR